MWKRILLFVVISILYIYILTQVFEYCINEASSTALTILGISTFLVLTFFYGRYFYNNIKTIFRK